MMERIILIETSTALCSVALAEDGVVVREKVSSEPRAHAPVTALFVKEILEEGGLEVQDCDAVAVSKGPGSYTGLRVGVSTAKGLCFGAGIPLVSVGTLDTLAWQAIDGDLLPEGCTHIVPMVDARRMEVYTGIFNNLGRQLAPTAASIVDGTTFAEILGQGPALFIGDGAMKCKDVIASDKAFFHQCCPKASAMLHPALEAFRGRRFEDVAYFEPFYLKEFITTTSKKKLF
ncbi:MAG: tRNA (adenosine(37)-N6)-threonylcarbamoyltransferase complex dimerization subunit type 1 TsaB [Candidatus Cryptobacteroides sp.]